MCDLCLYLLYYVSRYFFIIHFIDLDFVGIKICLYLCHRFIIGKIKYLVHIS